MILHHALTALLPMFMLAITTARSESSSYLKTSFAQAKNVA